MAQDTGAPGGTSRDGFAIFAATCALVALVFSVVNFFVAAHARNTAESARTAAEQALAAGGTSTGSTTPPKTALAAGTVAVTLNEFSIVLDPSSPAAGKVSFDVINDGKINHEFVMFRTDLLANALPTDKTGDVNEDSSQLQNVADSGSDLKPGTSRIVRATLTPGHYVAVCNLAGHYAAGMRFDVTVP